MARITKDAIQRGFINIFSSSELVAVYTIILYTILQLNIYTLFLFLANFLKTFILYHIKKVTIKYDFSKRPNGAFNCNMFSCGGKPKTGGMPSGHLTLVTMFMIIISINLYNRNYLTPTIIKIFAGILIFTIIGRYQSHCHTSLQIFAGIFLGILLGIFIYYIEKFIEESSPRFKENKDKFYKDFFNLEKTLEKFLI